jgi:hypothetical protein
VQATVAETAFGQEDDGVWWYAVVIDNPNADYVFEDAYLEIRAFAADGTAIDEATHWSILLQGRSIIVGRFFEVGDAQIASIAAAMPEASRATLSPGTETGAFQTAVASASHSDGSTSVTGTVSGLFADDQQYIAVGVVARSPDGVVLAATETYVDSVPGDGATVPFEAWFLHELPADTVFEASATRR